MNILTKIKKEVTNHNIKILFPESTEERILRSIKTILKEKICTPVLIGNKENIIKKAKKFKINLNHKKLLILDNSDKKLQEKYIKKLLSIRKNKGLTEKEAKELIKDINYFGALALKCGEAEGLISGLSSNTAQAIRPILQIIKTKNDKASGVFIMITKEKTLLFADCAINPNPDSKELAKIAIDTAKTASSIGIDPKIAMLSFSTAGSSTHIDAIKVKEATNIIKKKYPKIKVEGEIQADSALNPKTAIRKNPKTKIKGDANILIFPSLEAGNISYKLVEQLAKARAIGPIIQGLKIPIGGLSRGCTEKDITDLSAIIAYKSIIERK